MKSIARIIAMITLMISFCAATAQNKTIDFTQQLVNAAGVGLTESGKDGKIQPIELWEIAINALETASPSDAQLPGVKKFEMDELARKIYKSKKADLSADEIKMLKDRIGQQYPPLIVGASWRLLDGEKLVPEATK